MSKNLRIWLGGSFDPVHLGHLAIIQHIANTLKQFFITQNIQNINVIISLLPTAHNPLKPNPTENFHRLAMLELGLENLAPHPNPLPKVEGVFPSLGEGSGEGENSIHFQIDTTEIYQTETVFTFNTFTHFRQKYPDDSLIFALGMDSILAFERWYRAYELPNLCHLWVMPRLGGSRKNNAEKTEIFPKQLQPFLTQNLQDLILTNHGRIYLDEYNVMTVSSSQIRAILADKLISLADKKLRLQSYLTPSVLDYILERNLYHA